MRSASARRSFSVLVRGRPSRAGPPPAPALLARALLAEKDARFADAVREKDALLSEVRAAALRDVSIAKHDADVARSVVDARSLLEACIADLVGALVSAGRVPKSAASGSVSKRFALLFTDCREFVEYLEAAAAENRVPADVLLRQARKLYDVLSERVHAEAADGGTVGLPVELFVRSGRPTLVALAALARFAGRDLRLYKFDGTADTVKLRYTPGVARR